MRIARLLRPSLWDPKTSNFKTKVETHGLALRIILLAGNWARQGITYIDWSEKALKISVDAVLTGIIFIILFNFISVWISLVLAFFVAHTLNWLLNGHVWATVNELGFIKRRRSLEKTAQYADSLGKRITGLGCFRGAAVLGSFARDELSEDSDLDVLLMRNLGAFNTAGACLFLLQENVRAFVKRFPLDLHLSDSNIQHFAARIRPEEIPVLLHDPEKELERYYVKAVSINEIMSKYTARKPLS